ncbi:hypothetical protein P3C39_23875 [Mesorhizobium sp. XAP4]|uniref:hypothetical protein n=1 Tax=Mesorhizobium sp. XAP4 TaxID=3033799 RepID=UPI0023DF5628|nr:hypothetical protein [Mesorhizobium sp. XAP4]MDF3247906.1 hypothetical protein [Mesorhizobium sp. XAP4]
MQHRRPPNIEGMACDTFVGNKGFGDEELRAEPKQRDVAAVIPPHANRKALIPCNFAIYRWRHLIENVFCSLKQNLRIATHFDKTDQGFAAFIGLAALRPASR